MSQDGDESKLHLDKFFKKQSKRLQACLQHYITKPAYMCVSVELL